MQRGYFFFLIFLFASAVVLGSTIGLISNVTYIVQHTELLHTPSTKPTPDSNKSEDSIPDIHQPDNGLSSQNNSPSLTSSSSDSNEYMLISQEEKEQINKMLISLGMDEKDDPSQFIREYQKKNHLEVTGTLDSQTLEIIIKHTTLQGASRSLKRGINI